MRNYQKEIYEAVINKCDWIGNNTSVTTINNVTKVVYYRTIIAVVDHNRKTAHYNNGGYCNASTTARINAVKTVCNELNYKEV